MKIVIPDKVSKTSADMFEKAGYAVVQKPGIEIGECSELSRDADAVIVRSYKLHDLKIGDVLPLTDEFNLFLKLTVHGGKIDQPREGAKQAEVVL